MTAVQPWMLVTIVLLPFIGTIAIILLHNRPNAREAASLVTAILTFLFCIIALPSAFASQPVSTQSFVVLPGLNLQLMADALGLLFAGIASLLWIITTIYSIGYMRGLKEHSQTRYYACFAICIGSVMGVAFQSLRFVCVL
jgi:NADH:ubiquinone oxidoreductase subunit 5 (subunit L)/multisubunit Na+/H+ antiporter MnhA subunit